MAETRKRLADAKLHVCLRTLLCIIFAACFGSLSLHSQVAVTTSADESAAAFYKWYVLQINQGHIPLSQSMDTMKRYISPVLLRELRTGALNGDHDEDYFLKAQDTLEDWATHVSATSPTLRDGGADTIVTLGAASSSRHSLSVHLIQVDGLWKIRSVNRVRKLL